VTDSATENHLVTNAFPVLIAQYWQPLEQQHAIYKLAQEDKSQFERMLYGQYALLKQSTQTCVCKVDGALITIWQESQESFT
jgi:hypothetical protein